MPVGNVPSNSLAIPPSRPASKPTRSSRLDLWVAEEVLAVDAVVEQRHVGRLTLRLVLVEHGAVLPAVRALDRRALQRRVRLEVLRLAGLFSACQLNPGTG